MDALGMAMVAKVAGVALRKEWAELERLPTREKSLCWTRESRAAEWVSREVASVANLVMSVIHYWFPWRSELKARAADCE